MSLIEGFDYYFRAIFVHQFLNLAIAIMPKVRHDRAWVSERPKIRPKPKWTPEEDEKLLELKPKLLHGKWEKLSIELGHTPYDCVERWTELTQQFLRAKEQQQKEPKLMFFPSEAHKEAVNSLTGSGSAQLGIVAADNSALRATTKDDAAMISSVRNILGSVFNISVDNQMFDPAIIKLRECEEKAMELSKERDQLVKQKDSAIQEVRLWRTELEKARDHVAFLEEAVRGAQERARNAEIDAEAKDMEQRKTATLVEKQLLLAYINALQAQVQRSIKDVEWSDKNLDKPSKRLKIGSSSGEGDHLHLLGGSQGSIHPTTDDAQWEGNQATLDDLTTTDD